MSTEQTKGRDPIQNAARFHSNAPQIRVHTPIYPSNIISFPLTHLYTTLPTNAVFEPTNADTVSLGLYNQRVGLESGEFLVTSQCNFFCTYVGYFDA